MKLQALSPLFGAALTMAACWAAGSMLLARLTRKHNGSAAVDLRGAIERVPLEFTLGASLVHLGMFAIFALHLAYKPVLLALALATVLAAIVDRRRWAVARGFATNDETIQRFRWSDNIPAFGYAAIFAIFTILYFVNAWAPETSSDGSGYHLELIARYLRAHGFTRVTTNMYAGLGQGAEMLYALGFAFGRHSAAALVHLAFAIALAAMMLAYGLRQGKWWLGAGAALLVYLSPVVGRDTTTAYIDLIPAAVVFAVFYLLELWEDSGNDRLLIGVGLLAGYAYATKYTVGVVILYALVVVAWTRRSKLVKPWITVSAAAAVMALPWIAKNWIILRDPIFPFAATIFRNPYVHPSTILEWEQYLSNYDLPDRRMLPMDLIVHGSHVQGIIGPIFLLAPIALLALRYRTGRRLLAAGVVMLAPFFGNVGARFLIPCLAFFAMAMTMTVAKMPRVVAAMVLIHAVLSWPTAILAYANPQVWRILHFPLAAATRRESEDGYLRRALAGYPEARLVEKLVPPRGRVLAMGDIATSYTTRDVLVNFQGEFNQLLTDAINIGWYDGYRPKATLTFHFPARMIGRIRLLNTQAVPRGAQWSVHELRYLRDGVEVRRSSKWRLRAFPNSWRVQLAFDNSPATRWKTWETPAPGMFLETDFAVPVEVDEVRVETTDADRYYTRTLQVEMMDAGKWVKLADHPEEGEIAEPTWLRLAATHELHARGVDYLLMEDGEGGASDMADDPDAWGLVEVGRERHSTLYKIELPKGSQ